MFAQAEGLLPIPGAAEIGWHHDPRPEMGARVFACPRPEGASVTGAVAGIVRLEPVVRERMADLETPVSAFAKLRGLGGAFLLESAEGGERMGRYSFIGVAPREVIVSRDGDPLVRLRQAMAGYERAGGPGLPRFSGGAVGYVAYEAARHFETAERVGLLPRIGRSTDAYRYHKLVRDFLEDRLRREIGEAGIADLHRRVARYGETIDWKLAAHHYAAAGDIDDLRRILVDSIQDIMGGLMATPAGRMVSRT